MTSFHVQGGGGCRKSRKIGVRTLWMSPKGITLYKCCQTVFQQSMKEITNSIVAQCTRAHLDTRTKRRRLKTHLPHFYIFFVKKCVFFQDYNFSRHRRRAACSSKKIIICVSVMCFNFLSVFWYLKN